MFKAVAMVRFSAVVLQRDERKVLRELAQLGAVELCHTLAGTDTAPLPSRSCDSQVAACEELLDRIEQLRNALGPVGGPAKEAFSSAKTFEQAKKCLNLIEAKGQPLLLQRQKLTERHAKLAATIEQLSTYRGLNLPLNEEGQSPFLHFLAGHLPSENLQKFEQSIDAAIALVPIASHNGRQHVVALTTRRGEKHLLQALKKVDFRRDALPFLEGVTLDELLQTALEQQAAVSSALQSTQEQLRAFASKIAPALARHEQAVRLEKLLLQAEENFPRTESTVLLSGWVPEELKGTLAASLMAVSGETSVVKFSAVMAQPVEDVPVLLRESPVLRPFQRLVTAYGWPNYREVVPTVIFTLTYLLLFGVMFGDVGHGAVLALAGITCLVLKCHRRVLFDAGLMLIGTGLFSIAFGAAYGSFFGIPEFKKHAVWRDPLEGDPIKLMYLALSIGVLMVSMGLALNIVNTFRRRDLLGALLGRFGVMGLVFYWGMFFFLVGKPKVWNLAVVLFLLVPLLGWVIKEPVEYLRRTKGCSAKPGDGLGITIVESLVGALEAILSYLANTISFVRLAAYAMSHAAILLAAFMVSGALSQLAVVGGLLSILVVILGNLVAILLEGVVAGVQALRLEYYEFFGKFYSGNGRPFSPFRLNVEDSTTGVR